MADELNPIEQLIVKTLEGFGATKEDTLKTADAIAAKCSRPKGLVANALVALSNKGVIKRVVREKASGYYLVKK
jgi:predicted transcriptional regulator